MHAHDLWTDVDEVPRLLQATPNDDFEVEVKFDSPVTTRYQMQGLFVQQDAKNLLRIELHNDGGGTLPVHRRNHQRRRERHPTDRRSLARRPATCA